MLVIARRRALLGLAFAWVSLRAAAEQLPLRSYTTIDGLPHDRIKKIHVSRDGFVWFCTLEGLARFDGRSFTTFGVAEGIPQPSVNDVLETSGGYWIGTNGGGVAFIDPSRPAPRFHAIRTGEDASSRVNVVALDEEGSLVAGTDGGLFRLEGEKAFRLVPLEIPGWTDRAVAIWALLRTPRGLLAGTQHGLVLVSRSHPPRVVSLPKAAGVVTSLADPGDGTLLAGMEVGLVALDTESLEVRKVLTTADGLPGDSITALRAGEGRVLAGTERGLAIIEKSGVRSYGTSEGLHERILSAVAEDEDGGLWMGTPTSGAMRLLDSRSSLFDDKDGLAPKVTWVFEGFEGRPCAVSTGWTISCFDGKRFHSVRPPFAARLGDAAWRGHFGVLRDHEGALWIATHEGLYRFPSLSRLEDLPRAVPVARYTKKDGLVSDGVAGLLEDREGDVWIGTFAPVARPLMRWRRATSRVESFGAESGLPEFGSAVVLALDARGDVWIAYRDGTLARYREGRFRVVSGRNGFSSAIVTSLANDPAGRLWATTTGGGLVCVEKPDAAEPSARVYGAREGVPYFLKGIVCDDAGRVVFGTDRDLVRLDPKRGTLEKILADRVLIDSETDSAFRDSTGALWFATWGGAIRVLPSADRPRPPARVRVSAVRVDGAAVPVPASGVERLDLGELPPNARVSVELFGLGAIGQVLRFEHVVEGLEERWSPAAEERVLHYARFAPGRYRLRVRAAGASPEATVAFVVLAPFYARPWFLFAAAATLVFAGWSAKAVRARRKQELDAVRTRIAADLHDDLGAGLSRISILADVAKSSPDEGPGRDEALAKIADASRDVDERLADGLWAVDPSCDDLAGLAKRLRLLSEELFEPRGISWRVTLPEGAGDVTLRPDRRREIYLLAKEAVVNAAKHSGARNVTVHLEHDRRRVVVTVEDDGSGFEPDEARADRLSGGRGVSNMRRRAAALGGTAELTSAPGRGTRVRFEVPKGRG